MPNYILSLPLRSPLPFPRQACVKRNNWVDMRRSGDMCHCYHLWQTPDSALKSLRPNMLRTFFKSSIIEVFF